MADPEVKNVNLLSELTDVAAGDTLIINDVSAVDDLADMTKQIRMDKIKLFFPSQITDGIVTMSKIANGVVTSDKLYNGVVIYNQHISDNCIGSANLANGSVTANKINTGGINLSGQFAPQVVNTAAIKDANVTLAKLASNSVDASKIVDGSVTEAKLGAIKRTVAIPVFGFEDGVIVKNFTNLFSFPPMLNGHIITSVSATLLGAVSVSGAITIKLINGLNEMASVTINQNAWSGTATPNTSYDDVASFGKFSVNVTGAGSGAKGLTVYLEVTG